MTGNARTDNSGHTAHYASLGGCVNDVALVECFLKTELGILDEHIIKLTSTAPDDDAYQGRPKEDMSVWPTYRNIARAFARLSSETRRGDLVYIHYSGHGARVRTAYERVKGQDGIDEALVPVDIEVVASANMDQAKYLRDVEIAQWLQDLVGKGLEVTVVLDSCHAGGSTRRKESATPRGTGFIDRSLLQSDLCVGSQNSCGPAAPASLRHGRVGKSWLLEASGYTLLAACTAFQKAYEHTFAERQHGALTYHLIDTLRRYGQDSVSAEALLSRIAIKVQSYFSEQTPLLEGETTMAFFGVSSRACPVHRPLVLAVDPASGLVELDHGDLHGVHVGAEYGVYRDDTSFPSDMIAKIRVTKPQGLKATAAFIGPHRPPDWAAVRPGFRALLLKQAPEKMAGVRLVVPNGTEPGAEHVRARLTSLRRHIEEQKRPPSLWCLLPDEDVGGYESVPLALSVTITPEGFYELLDASQAVLPNLPKIPAADPASSGSLLACLSHVVRFRLVQRLGADPVSALRTPCRFELLGKSTEPPMEADAGDNLSGELIFPAGLELAPLHNGAYTVSSGEVVSVEFENRGKSPVYLTVLDLKPLWGIEKLYPAGAGASECVGPGEKRMLPIQMEIPTYLSGKGRTEITETLRAVVTVRHTSLQALELPDIHEYSTRDTLFLDFTSALDQLLKDLSPASRDVKLKGRSGGSWQIYDINVRTTSGTAETATFISAPQF
ncbi:hypothetical protein MFIFM68171_07360 [Madurella fahalii]|uniref:Peptidase C14 caspase domain-containing protein n=1 Tax=Madurella fahalii TaxID=1157608 RepID=A0ABQ0GHA9_9PEZI